MFRAAPRNAPPSLRGAGGAVLRGGGDKDGDRDHIAHRRQNARHHGSDEHLGDALFRHQRVKDKGMTEGGIRIPSVPPRPATRVASAPL